MVYEAEVWLPGERLFRTKVLSAQFGKQDQVLIGRNLLAHMRLEWDGPRNLARIAYPE